MHVSCGNYQELGQGDSVTHLHYNMRDMVYLLVHTSEGTLESSPTDCSGAPLDMFRRQDNTKLAKYLKMKRRIFQNPYEYCTDDFVRPYLNEYHKRQLKKEFGVEPLSFEQRRGEAIFIPAGSTFQVKNPTFPESVREGVRLAEEIRCLPNNMRQKHQILEIGKLSLYAASSAIKEVQKLVLDPNWVSTFKYLNLTKAITEKLDHAVKRPQ
ncbi:hypothetical protein CARUB_v10022296mg [Capsella rubella]|uniref:JmjC domain-containing protein n=1 Tax=Capsella rubella TaxID=81985 RepID=R0I9D3_9BRAS|nr:hypothetical protein CARUB_v10022296mg [Capsella rubella]